jgi:P27 family predicted phage terminase small subunit
MVQRGRKSAAQLAVTPFIRHQPAIVRAPPPPDHLSPAMQQFWADETAAFEFSDHHLKLLQAACESWDRMTQARQEVAATGLTYIDGKGQRRPNPAVAIERDCRTSFARLLRDLGLNNPKREREAGNRRGY